MRFIILMALTTILTSCCQPTNNMIFAPGTYQYVQRFTMYSYQQGQEYDIVNLAVVFAPLIDDNIDVVGQCVVSQGETPVIRLQQEFWDNSDDMDREQLMFHELGHCILGRSHTTKMMFGDVPNSIMYPYFISEWDYVTYHNHYIHELFYPGQ